MASNRGKRKPYQVQQGPQASDIDAMFEELYRRIAEVEANAGGAAEADPHDLLSSQHEDTTAAAVVNGDAIIGQGGKWARKAKGADGQHFVMVSGAPEWSNDGSALENLDATELDGIVPTASVLHDILSAHHQDSTPATGQLGDLITARNAGSVEHSKYWLAGEACDIVPTSRDPGTVRYWRAGGAMESVATEGNVKWQRKAVGASGTVPVSDGVRWEWQELGAVTGNVGAAAYRSSNFNLADTTPTAVQLDTESFDDGGFWTSSSPTRMTIPAGYSGIYAIVGAACWPATCNARTFVSIYVNGTLRAQKMNDGENVTPPYLAPNQVSAILKLNAGDYVELYVEQRHNATGTAETIQGGEARTFLQLAKV